MEDSIKLKARFVAEHADTFVLDENGGLYYTAKITDCFDLDLILLKNPDGTDNYVEFAGAYADITDDELEAFSDFLIPYAVITRHASDGDVSNVREYVSGYAFVGGRALLLAVAPMPLVDGKRYSVIVGIVLDGDFVNNLITGYDSEFNVKLGKGERLDPYVTLTDETGTLTIPRDMIDGGLLHIAVHAPRSFFQSSLGVKNVLVLSFILGAVLFVAVLYRVLVSRILTPIEFMRKDIQNSATLGLSENAIYQQNIEFFELFTAINEMARRINEGNLSIEMFQNVCDNIDATLYVTARDDDKLLFVNERCKKDFRLKDDDVGQPCWMSIQNGQVHRCDFCPINKLRGDGKGFSKCELGNQNGHIYSNTTCAFTWYGIPAYLHHGTDITEQRLLQQSLMASIETAESANKAKSEFLASMSHELRTPLNAVNGLAELELRKPLPSDTKINLEKILGAGTTLLNIINDLLDISKIEAGKMELLPVEYDLTSLISDIVCMNIVRVGDKPIRFVLNLDERLPKRLFGDELRVKQIFSNLLSNAIKYTQAGFVELGIFYEKDERGFWLTGYVKDSGSGIAAENIPLLFGDYEQIDQQAHRTIEGTGLGLSITKKLVELMYGKIKVVSTLGQGSTFSVKFQQKIVDELPIGKETVESLKGFRFFEEHSRGAHLLEYTPLPGHDVLIVDDVVTNLDVAAGMMEGYELNIHRALSGWQAVDMVRDTKSARYDIIFLDHMMPGIDGLETARIIRGLGTAYAENVPIIALTANAVIGTEQMFLDSGFQGYLSKPMDINKLDAVIKRFIPVKIEKTDAKAEIPEKPAKPELTDRQRKQQEAERKLAELRAENIVGLNIDEGLVRLNNRADTYIKIVTSFVNNIPKYLGQLETNAVDEDMPAYAITVHGIKSSCRSIGAIDLGDSAQLLEQYAKDGDSIQVHNRHTAFCAAMSVLLAQLSVVIK